MCLLKESWAAYSFSQNCDRRQNIWCPSFRVNFFYINAWYCFCEISEINEPLCMKIHIEVSHSVFFATPQVIEELVSPIGTYVSFPKVTYFRTVQHSELVQTTTCHCFIFGVWTFYHRKYSLCPIWNILWNFIWTLIAQDIAIIIRCLI